MGPHSIITAGLAPKFITARARPPSSEDAGIAPAAAEARNDHGACPGASPSGLRSTHPPVGGGGTNSLPPPGHPSPEPSAPPTRGKHPLEPPAVQRPHPLPLRADGDWPRATHSSNRASIGRSAIPVVFTVECCCVLEPAGIQFLGSNWRKHCGAARRNASGIPRAFERRLAPSGRAEGWILITASYEEDKGRRGRRRPR